MKRKEDLSTPAGGSRGFGLYYDPEAFGRFSEAIAQWLGTARYLVFQTLVIAVWIVVNSLFPSARFDEYPYILLTLALSMQASYAAPLILLAQNRQETRDRAESDQDRAVNARTQADTEFLAREVASIRLALADVVTTDDLAERLDEMTDAIRRLESRLGDARAQ